MKQIKVSFPEVSGSTLAYIISRWIMIKRGQFMRNRAMTAECLSGGDLYSDDIDYKKSVEILKGIFGSGNRLPVLTVS